MVDERKILNLLNHYFDATAIIADERYDFDSEGRLNVYQGVASKTYKFPNNQLPIRFGHIEGSFDVSSCNLTTLDGCPISVAKNCRLDRNQLTTLIGAPQVVGQFFHIGYMNTLENLDGFPAKAGTAIFTWQPTLPVLRLLNANAIGIVFDEAGAQDKSSATRVLQILRKYAGQGRAGAIDCKRELVAAGFEGNARW